MTEAEARKLGIKGAPAAKKRTTGKATPAKDCSPVRCVTCGETFTSETAETRHNAETRHARFETVMDV
jgi:hypothetical protein